jgi:hypothetical protein
MDQSILTTVPALNNQANFIEPLLTDNTEVHCWSKLGRGGVSWPHGAYSLVETNQC